MASEGNPIFPESTNRVVIVPLVFSGNGFGAFAKITDQPGRHQVTQSSKWCQINIMMLWSWHGGKLALRFIRERLRDKAKLLGLFRDSIRSEIGSARPMDPGLAHHSGHMDARAKHEETYCL